MNRYLWSGRIVGIFPRAGLDENPDTQPLLAQALPLVNQAIIEINSVLPAAPDILAYLQTKPADVPSTVDIMTQQGSGPT